MRSQDLSGSVTASSSTAQLCGEELITLTDAAKETPTRPTVRTVWRWAGKGVGGVRLETVKVGGRTFTSVDAIRRFLRKLNSEELQDVAAEFDVYPEDGQPQQD